MAKLLLYLSKTQLPKKSTQLLNLMRTFDGYQRTHHIILLERYEQEDAIIMDKQEENQGDHQPKRRARARRPRNRSISSLEGMLVDDMTELRRSATAKQTANTEDADPQDTISRGK